MTPLMLAWTLALGLWAIQDGIASILYYDGREKMINQFARIARIVVGIALVILSSIALGGK